MRSAVKGAEAFKVPSGMRYRDGSSVEDGAGYHPHKTTRFENWASARCPDKLPELYGSRAECCGCTACVFACPADAVSMVGDEEGFEYPAVDAAKCVGCGRCMEVCSFKERLLDVET